MSSQFVLTAAPGDTVRITAKDVADVDGAPVTTGLTGTVTVYVWDTDAIAIAATPINGNSGDDWWCTVTAPAEGRYRVIVLILKSGAQRTLRGELKVSNPLT